jgi:hypothetical protein
MVDRGFYEIGVEHGLKQVLVVTDGDDIAITDFDGEILAEHTRPAPGVTYGSNRRTSIQEGVLRTWWSRDGRGRPPRPPWVGAGASVAVVSRRPWPASSTTVGSGRRGLETAVTGLLDHRGDWLRAA